MPQQLAIDVLVSPADRRRTLLADVRSGLTGAAKTLPPTWFYDEAGSRLFEAITRLDEYYPTRTERAILAAHAETIAAASGADTLVEVGSGTSEKTRLLLDAMAAAGTLRNVVLLDISEEVLAEAAATLAADYGVQVHAVVGDLRRHLPAVPKVGGRRLWALLGGTVGNFGPRARARLLLDFQTSMSPDDCLLLGADRVKDVGRLLAAYDDAAGVTAAFNRNVLAVLNRELHADFDVEGFAHRAVWNPAARHIEMRLAARGAPTVHIADLDLTVPFIDGEEILTETSAKFTPGELADELAAAGLVDPRTFTDPAGDFELTLCRPYC